MPNIYNIPGATIYTFTYSPNYRKNGSQPKRTTFCFLQLIFFSSSYFSSSSYFLRITLPTKIIEEKSLELNEFFISFRSHNIYKIIWFLGSTSMLYSALDIICISCISPSSFGFYCRILYNYNHTQICKGNGEEDYCKWKGHDM